ncbi:MAG: hypothetical protein ACM3S0_06130 [Acidobacteriota bacterium]
MSKNNWVPLGIIALFIASTASCGPAPASPSDKAAVPSPLATVAPITPPESAPGKDKNQMSATPNPTSPPTEMAQVTQAKQDLSKRLSVSADQIELVTFTPVTWPDGSLGCPEPGMMYTQVLVEGYRIQLRSGGQVYEYHGGGTRAPFLCAKPS